MTSRNEKKGGAAQTARPTTQEDESPMPAQPIVVTIVGRSAPMYSRWYWFKWRLSKHFHPQRVTELWYAQDCPAVLDTSCLTLRGRVGWAIDKWLRECNRRGEVAA